MKVLLLGNINSIHLKRWALSLAKKVDLLVVSIDHPADKYYEDNGISYVCIKHFLNGILPFNLQYIILVYRLKQIINVFNPDLVHAHYASGYGLMGVLTGFSPVAVSAWGSDVYLFPKESFIKKHIIKYVFKKADFLLSTSNLMAKEMAYYTDKKVWITPFGINTSHFKPTGARLFGDRIAIGITKSLEPKYGFDILFKAFALLVNKTNNSNLLLVIVGEGPYYDNYKLLAKQLGIADNVRFMGRIENEKLPDYYSSFYISSFPSLSESFGVSALESMSCGCPVVTSDADGYKEIILDGVTGTIVPIGETEKLADALLFYLKNPLERDSAGLSGRNHVVSHYEWADSVETMVTLYNHIYLFSNN